MQTVAAILLLLAPLALAGSAAGLPLCHDAAGAAQACAYDHAAGSHDCAESPSAGSRHTVAYVDAAGLATLFVAGAHECERSSPEKGGALRESDSVRASAATHNGLPETSLQGEWRDDRNAGAYRLTYHALGYNSVFRGWTPAGAPDPGWGGLLP